MDIEPKFVLEEPRATPWGAFSRGFVTGMAMIFVSAVLALGLVLAPGNWRSLLSWLLWARMVNHPGLSYALGWLGVGTLLCLAAFFSKREELVPWFRGGLAAAFGVFLLLVAASWMITI